MSKRETPLDSTVIGKNGLALATRYLKWAGKNFPGYVGTRQAASLVSTSYIELVSWHLY